MRPAPLKKGPYRPFLGSDFYESLLFNELRGTDVLMSVLLGLSFILHQIKILKPTTELNSTEVDLFEAITHYKNGEFFITEFPPLLIQILSSISSILKSVPNETLQYYAIFTGALTISVLYLTMRVSNVKSAIAVLAVSIISRLPLFTKECIHLSPVVLHTLFLSCGVLSWNILKRTRLYSTCWYLSLLSLGSFISLSAGSKFVGVVTWCWFLFLVAKRSWEIAGDADVQLDRLLVQTIWRTAAVGFIPLAVLTSSYFTFLSNSRIPSSNHSGLVSPYFKSWFVPETMPQPDVIYYGSNLLIRHAPSLGGYLHSHNYTYRGGSGEQQVSLFIYSNDADNEWIIEPSSDTLEYKTKLEPVKNGASIKLRHRTTGKLLRASSAKPPISEQDYDHEVSCTGDEKYRGDADETWRLRFERGKTVHDGLLCPFTIYFSLENKGHNCKLLSHDLRLPDWGFEQQEVLCVDSADKERSLFFIDRSNLYKERGAYISSPKHWIGKRLWTLTLEYVQRQYKFDYYLKNKDARSDIKRVNWLLNIADSAAVNFMWFIPLASLVGYILVECFRWIKWDPWADTSSEVDPVKYLYLDSCQELATGWFMHYYIFAWSKHDNITVTQYLPSYVLSLLLAAQTANFLWNYGKITRLLLVGSSAAAMVITHISN
ncbi:LADA_0H11034g1_1 [Lachancea dasiensis]|uniref:dolichyl-phosphate-mannose--protein mannosyltransferase n=1 Tax=Lachancea dasiensis TaxID=1072105 RepID=A0A1G4K3D3_9SACH|nr:LADA_0H11034g1_1 [Lachancea dasiensis]